MKRQVTQEDLDLNPDLGKNGIILGDEIEIAYQKVPKKDWVSADSDEIETPGPGPLIPTDPLFPPKP